VIRRYPGFSLLKFEKFFFNFFSKLQKNYFKVFFDAPIFMEDTSNLGYQMLLVLWLKFLIKFYYFFNWILFFFFIISKANKLKY